jgi:TraM recognition site of TraD and TraG
LFIDEFANLPRNTYIKKWLELARSRGARSVICTQSISQLREIYGNNDTDAILNLLSNVISLRVGAGGEDAKYVSRIFGEKIVERLDSTGLYAKWIRSKEPLVEEFEITQLKPTTDKGVEGYLFVPGWNATYKLVWPLFTKEAIAKKHCPAVWLEDRDEKDKDIQEKINRLNKRVI